MSWFNLFKIRTFFNPGLQKIIEPLREEDKILLLLSSKPKVFGAQIETQIVDIRKKCLLQDINFLDIFLDERSIHFGIQELEKGGYIQYNRYNSKWNLSSKARERIKILSKDYPENINLVEALMHDWLEDKKSNPNYS
jgi:hypothetical protein